jgi:hypothetical protein
VNVGTFDYVIVNARQSRTSCGAERAASLAVTNFLARVLASVPLGRPRNLGNP